MIQPDGEIAPAVGEPEVPDVADPHAVHTIDMRFPLPIGMLRKARPDARSGATSIVR